MCAFPIPCAANNYRSEIKHVNSNDEKNTNYPKETLKDALVGIQIIIYTQYGRYRPWYLQLQIQR